MLGRLISSYQLNLTTIQRAIWIVVLVAISLRLWNFATGRSLWLDEAMLSISIVHLPAAALLGQLEFNQMAPIGWLLLEKASLLISSDIDYSLRLVALVGGALSVLVFWRFMAFTTGPWETLVGVALFGLTSVLIRYSVMVKPYVLDALFSTALLYAAVVMLRNQDKRLQLTAILACIGVVCLLMSFGGTIVMAAIGPVLFAASIAQGDRRWSIALAATGCVWALGLGALYILVYAQQGTTVGNMTNIFWFDSFAPLPTSLANIVWYPKAIVAATSFIVPGLTFALLAVFLLFGCIRIGTTDPWLLALMISPLLAALLISGVQAYPFNSRFLLFLAPPLVLGVSVGVVAVAQSFNRPAMAFTVLAALVCVGPLAITARAAAKVPAWPLEEIKQNLDHLSKNLLPGDRIFINQKAESAYLLYSKRFGLDFEPYSLLKDYRLDLSCVYDDVRAISGTRRAWIIVYHLAHERERNSVDLLAQVLSHSGTLTTANMVPGSRLYKFEAGPEPRERLVLPSAAAKCDEPRESATFLDAIAIKSRALGRIH